MVLRTMMCHVCVFLFLKAHFIVPRKNVLNSNYVGLWEVFDRKLYLVSTLMYEKFGFLTFYKNKLL